MYFEDAALCVRLDLWDEALTFLTGWAIGVLCLFGILGDDSDKVLLSNNSTTSSGVLESTLKLFAVDMLYVLKVCDVMLCVPHL